MQDEETVLKNEGLNDLWWSEPKRVGRVSDHNFYKILKTNLISALFMN